MSIICTFPFTLVELIEFSEAGLHVSPNWNIWETAGATQLRNEHCCWPGSLRALALSQGPRLWVTPLQCTVRCKTRPLHFRFIGKPSFGKKMRQKMQQFAAQYWVEGCPKSAISEMSNPTSQTRNKKDVTQQRCKPKVLKYCNCFVCNAANCNCQRN